MSLKATTFLELFPHYAGHDAVTGVLLKETMIDAWNAMPPDAPIITKYIYWSKMVRDILQVPLTENVEDAKQGAE